MNEYIFEQISEEIEELISLLDVFILKIKDKNSLEKEDLHEIKNQTYRLLQITNSEEQRTEENQLLFPWIATIQNFETAEENNTKYQNHIYEDLHKNMSEIIDNTEIEEHFYSEKMEFLIDFQLKRSQKNDKTQNLSIF